MFDGIVDFDAVVRDPAAPTKIRAEFDSGDHLHPNDAGYKAMGESIDLALFKPSGS
jgi:lysophospholipase L1-like esterase